MASRSGFALLIGAALFLFLLVPADATIFNVANGDITGLKNAITTSGSNGQDDTIELAANGTYTLTTVDNALNGLPLIGADGNHTLTIHGNGATITRDDAGPMFRILYIISGANVLLDGLTIDNGFVQAHGGGIYSEAVTASTTLTISNCKVTNNEGDYGGGIYNDGHNTASIATLVVTNSTFSNNYGYNVVGAIYNYGSSGHVSVTVSNCLFTHNNGQFATGAIHMNGSMGQATGTVTNCTFDQNTTTQNGGAIYVNGNGGSATLAIKGCTFSLNNGNVDAGAIYNSGGGAVIQLANNILQGGAVFSENNIVNSGGTITSLGHNISDEAGSGVLTGPGDQINTDPRLDPNGLQSNGGPTQTVALLSGSPAINAGDAANAPGRDQRYFERFGAVDIGAFEFAGTLAPISAGSVKTHGAAGSFTVDFPLTGAAGVECRIGGGGNNYQIVMPFGNPVTAVGASLTSGVGSVSNFAASGSELTVNLTGITNAQQINLRLTSVSDGTHTNNVDIPMRFLLGDTSANSTVNASDVTQVKQQLGQPLSSSNFRRDINANGTINASDVTLTKAAIGTSIP
jgi:predicted outer membrane repeat protein